MENQTGYPADDPWLVDPTYSPPTERSPMDETVDAEAIRIHRRKDERWMMMLDHYRYWLKPTKHSIEDAARYPS